MATVDTLQVRIEADMKDLKRGLRDVKQRTNDSTKSMTTAFTKLGKVVGVVAGALMVRELGRGAVAAVNFAADVEEMQSKSSVVFGSFAGEVRDSLGAFANEVGRSRFELEGMASSIQDTFVPMGFARGEASKLSVELTKLATDVASFNNASDTETMRAFQSALVGNHETVRRFGIVITEATLQQELFRMGITKSADEVTNSEKVQARLNLITAGTTDAHGDAAKTADSYANRQKALKSATDELTNSLGQIFMPIMSGVTESLIGAAKHTNDWLHRLGAVGDAIGDIRLNNLRQQLREVNTELEELGETTEVVDDLLTPMGGGARTQKLAEQERLQAKINEILNERKRIIEETHTVQTRDQMGLDPEPEAKAPAVLNKSQIKANDDLKQSIADVRFENELLKASMHGASEADLEMMRIRNEFKGVNEEQLSILQEETRLRMALEEQKLNEEEASKRQQELALETVAKQKEQIDLLEELGMRNKDFTEQLNLLREAEEMGTISSDEYNEALGRLNIKMFESTEAGSILMNGLNRTTEELSKTMADSLMGMGDGWKGFKDSLKGIVRDIIAQFIKMQIQAFITKQAMSFMGGGFMGFGGGGGGGGVGFAAEGNTSLNSKQPFVVGERGPELFVPNTSGSIMSNAQSKKISGGGKVVNQTLNFDVGVAQTVRSEILSLMPTIKQESITAMVDAKERGGRVADVFK